MSDRTPTPDAGAASEQKRWSGWLFHNPDTGTELSESHPVRSGECDDAENVRPATREALRDELLVAWQGWAEARQELEASREGPIVATLTELLDCQPDKVVERVRGIVEAQAIPGGLSSYFRDHPEAMPLRARHSVRMEDGSYHVELGWVVNNERNTTVLAAEMNLGLILPWGSVTKQQAEIYDQAIALANAWNWARHRAAVERAARALQPDEARRD